MKTKHILITMLWILILVIVFNTREALAQPALPLSPSQAPIDGGLGLLAAAGGIYALKRLKSKKE